MLKVLFFFQPHFARCFAGFAFDVTTDVAEKKSAAKRANGGIPAVVELVSRIRTRSFHSGLFEYDVRVHNGRRVCGTRRGRVDSGAWHSRHGERRAVGGHHRVHRTPADYLLHDGFFVSV